MNSKLLVQYIFEQPEVIARVVNQVNSLEPDVLKRLRAAVSESPMIYLIGSGSSLNAAYTARSSWKALGPVEVLDPVNFMLDLQKGLVRPGSVAIGISQSGQSFATVDALRKANECGAYTVSVTANSNSPIAQAAKDILLIPCGEELIGPKTKGYSATVALLIGTALALKGTQITDESVKTIKSYLGQKDTIDSVAAACPRTNLCFVIGSGDNLGTAREGALKIMEIAKIPSMYFDLEDSMHGPFTTLDDNSFVVVLGIDSYMQERMAGLLKILQHLGAKGILVTSGTISPLDGASAEEGKLHCDPAADIVPIQLLANEFAILRGENPTELSYDRTFVRSITKLSQS